MASRVGAPRFIAKANMSDWRTLPKELADAVHGPEQDAEFLALQLDGEAQGSEALSALAARLARDRQRSLKSIEADNRTRRQRLERQRALKPSRQCHRPCRKAAFEITTRRTSLYLVCGAWENRR